MVSIVGITDNLKDLYQYHSKIAVPYRYPVNFVIWEKTFLHDIDGKGGLYKRTGDDGESGRARTFDFFRLPNGAISP